MVPSLAALGLVLQAAANPHAVRFARVPEPVRVWRTDSTAYIQLREPGHVTLLYVDGIGRIQVLYPLVPDDPSVMSADAPVAVDLPPEAQSNPATLVAIRSRWSFDFATLRLGSWWDYQNALLLQPTAGDPLAAILDIAERVTDGRPYDYGEVTYARDGTVLARGPVRQPDVCLSCVRHGTAVAQVSPGPVQNSVDCSSASLTNSFCGVNSGTVSITSPPVPAQQVVYQPAPPPQPVYVPYYMPVVVNDGFFVPHQPMITPPTPAPSTPPPPRTGVAFPVHQQLIVPSSSLLQTVRTMRH